MFNFKKKFSQNISIDLGTSNILLHTGEKGIIVNEASVVAINNKTDQIISVGHEAKKMIGRIPPYINVIKPLVHGIVSDFEVTEKMLKYFIERIQNNHLLNISRPRVIIGIPIGITEVEKKAVEDAVMSAGVKEVFLIELPIAAALGAGLRIGEASGNLIVDIGGGITEIAVIALEGVVNWKKLDIAGNKFDHDIIQAVRDEFNVLLGENIAEDVKIKIGSAIPLEKELRMNVRGRDLVSGLPKEIILNNTQIKNALNRSLTIITDNIKSILEITPPELVADIYQKGIIVCGGGALLKGLEKFIKSSIKIPVIIAEDPLTCSIRGASVLFEDEKMLKNIISFVNNGPIIK